MKIYLRLLKYLKSYWKSSLGALLCMLIFAVCNVSFIPLVGMLSDAIGGKSLSLLNFVILASIAINLLKGLAMYGQMYLMAFAAQKVVKDLRVHVFKHLQDLSLDFYSKWKTGDVISRVINDITIIQSALVVSVTEIFPSLVTFLGVCGYLIYLNWRLTLLTAIIIPVIAFITSIFGEQMRQISHSAQSKAADIASILQEKITGIRVVKSFAMEKHEISKFTDESEKSFWLTMKQMQINATQTPLLTFLQFIAVIAVIWYGAFEVLSGRLSASNLIAFFSGVALLATPISNFSRINLVIQQALSSADRVFEVIDIQPSVKESPNAIKIDSLKGEIIFNQVSFKYENEQDNIIDNLSINIKSGEIIALVGPSGSGKTTFVNLIPRFYDPVEGLISIDGHDLKQIKLESLRQQMGMVPQDTMLFAGSIKENIAYSKLNATEAEIIAAAKAAHAHEFIQEQPKGYNTLIGERGIILSGGQKQRLAIARALLRNPKILIFDEATSSLDSESEKLVQDAMNTLMQGRTTIVIAHRLSTIQHADRILVLSKGKVVEQGKHAELLTQGGLYKKLYDLQFKDEDAHDKNIIHN